MQASTSETLPPPPRRTPTTANEVHLTPAASHSQPMPPPPTRSFSGLSLASKARSAFWAAGSFVASTATQAASTASQAASSVSQRAEDGTWEEWFKDWKNGRSFPRGTENIQVLPGWAVKRFREGARGNRDQVVPFDLHISTLGFCNRTRDPGSATRSQRAFISLAKRFAALPKLMLDNTDEKVRPFDPNGQLSLHSEPLSDSPASTPGLTDTPSRKIISTDQAFADPSILRKAYDNLDIRLWPFWSSVLPNRRITLSVYNTHKTPFHSSEEPFFRTSFSTNASGNFTHHMVIPWEVIEDHHLEYRARATNGKGGKDPWVVRIKAELLPEPVTPKARSFDPTLSRGSDGQNSRPPSVYSRDERAQSEEPESDRKEADAPPKPQVKPPEATTTITVAEPGGVRVLSDLDDTIKHSDILAGPREVFRNVFCRPVEDICVPGMSDLFRRMEKAGVSGFHFVSNSPFELLPTISDFFRVHNFPKLFSLKLKFYGGRSIVSSLLESPGDRKRQAILEIFDTFNEAKFVCFGDSGEQDLELYTSLAMERPEQILAIFIRDVTSDRIEGLKQSNLVRQPSLPAVSSQDSIGTVPLTYKPRRSATTDTTSSTVSASSTISTSSSRRGSDTPPAAGNPGPTGSTDDLTTSMEELQALTSAQQKILKRAALWEARLDKARHDIPESVPLIIFKDVEEIGELAPSFISGHVAMNE